MITKSDEIHQYWADADSRESTLMAYIDELHNDLFEEVLMISNRFSLLEGSCTPREVERLHRKIKTWKEQGLTELYTAKLYMKDVENRQRIKKEEALFLWLLAAFSGVYLKVIQRDTKMLLQVSDVIYRREGGLRKSITDAQLKQFLGNDLPDGTSYQTQLSSYAEYASRRFSDVIRINRMQSAEISEEELGSLLDASKNRLLKQSKPSEGQPVNFHGYLDQVMTSVVGHTIMRVFRESGVKEYRFIATIDDRTTDACRWLNDKIFKVSDMRLGVNVPPITISHDGTAIPHPCRSIIRAVR